MTEGEHIAVDINKSNAVMALLFATAEGPAEAYAVLITCLHRLNFEYGDPPASIDDLVAEISTSIRSVSDIRRHN